jgi:glycyl-tRNA synthetase beta chain
VHWVVALLGSELVPLTLFGIRAGRESDGHRFLGARKVPIGSPAAYEETLAAQKVFADRAARRAALSRRLVEIAGEEGVRPVEDAGLLEEVTDLVEYPGATLGSFPAEFLELPREILVTTLRHHQKAFSTETDDGVSNRFLVVSDTDRDAEGHIRKGNEWVVVGRLEDARFFFHEDRKVPFAGRAAKLENVTFHAAAGSYAEKSRRIESLALALGSIVNSRLNERTASGGAQGGGRNGPGKPGEAPSWPADAGALRAAARLAKCDLTTGLVGEFPELQGIAGGIYVGREAAEGSDPHPRGAAEAIYDQYRPAGAGDALPRTSEGILLALADRLDSLAALATFVGLPTGSKDPFGLRRAAYSVIRLGVEGGLPLGAAEMLAAARSTMGDRGAAPAPAAAKGAPEGAGARTPPGASEAELLAFLFERLEFWLKEKGSRYDTINAVLLARDGARAPGEELPRLAEKVFALERLRELPDSAALVEIHKRCRNILQQAQGTDPAGTLDTVLKQDPEEPEALAGLAGPVAEAGRTVQEAMKRDDFEGALQALVRLRPALSRFFDHVLVMHPDPATRRERLDLVRRTALMIEEVADLKQISISRDELQKQLDQLK